MKNKIDKNLISKVDIKIIETATVSKFSDDLDRHMSKIGGKFDDSRHIFRAQSTHNEQYRQ